MCEKIKNRFCQIKKILGFKTNKKKHFRIPLNLVNNLDYAVAREYFHCRTVLSVIISSPIYYFADDSNGKSSPLIFAAKRLDLQSIFDSGRSWYSGHENLVWWKKELKLFFRLYKTYCISTDLLTFYTAYIYLTENRIQFFCMHWCF